MLRIKIISSLEKCFPDQSVKSKPELKSASFLKNERYSFQVCYHRDEFLDSKVFDHLTVDPMDCSTPGLPVHHQLPDSTQTHVH